MKMDLTNEQNPGQYQAVFSQLGVLLLVNRTIKCIMFQRFIEG